MFGRDCCRVPLGLRRIIGNAIHIKPQSALAIDATLPLFEYAPPKTALQVIDHEVRLERACAPATVAPWYADQPATGKTAPARARLIFCLSTQVQKTCPPWPKRIR